MVIFCFGKIMVFQDFTKLKPEFFLNYYNYFILKSGLQNYDSSPPTPPHKTGPDLLLHKEIQNAKCYMMLDNAASYRAS